VTGNLKTNEVMTVLLTALAYYLAPRVSLGFTLTVSPESIAIFWPPNGILLAVLLIQPYRLWPYIAAGVMLAEIAVDLPVFPLWTAVCFGLINLFETGLAAWLIRRTVPGEFNFDRLDRGMNFLLFGPLVAAMFAGLMGAWVYTLLGRTDLDLHALWNIWWLGDALGLILFTPIVVLCWRRLQHGKLEISRRLLIETVLLWLVILTIGVFVFQGSKEGEIAFLFRPVWLLPFVIVAALRLGLIGASATVIVIAAQVSWYLTQGIHPYHTDNQQYAVWLTQTYLTIIALVSVGLAMIIREITEQRDALRMSNQRLQEVNAMLEERVLARTYSLEKAKQALELANENLATTAATDDLTGMANRRHFYSEAARELSRLRRDGQKACLIMVDLDYFKSVNDTYGHEAGDVVLRAIEHPMRMSVRPRDLMGRTGGEEFLILLSGVDIPVAITIAERIRTAIQALEIDYRGYPINITASLGIARWDGKSELNELINQADEALYMAKKNGRNRTEVIQTLAATSDG
jgi:diguanylate cyclase (GGDEF)-like protein